MGRLYIPEKQLIKPQEAIKISYTQGGASTLFEVKAISDEWGIRYSDPTFNHYCMLAAVYTAGYIQGKREERARTAQRKAKAEARRKNDRLEMWRDCTKELLDKADNEPALKDMYNLVSGVLRH